MKKSIATTLLAAIILSTTANAALTWPMFERADVVTLQGKEIPADFKRTSITDTKGRAIQGEWLEINRKTKTVKFRKADGKDFELPFANLAETDRRYAELETGYTWNIGESPPVPIDLFDTSPYSHINNPIHSPHNIYLGEGNNVINVINSAKVINETTIQVVVGPGEMGNPFGDVDRGDKNYDLPINMLTNKDRELIKKATGVEAPILPRPAWSNENAKYWINQKITGKTEDGKDVWSSIRYHFDKPMPQFEPGEIIGTNNALTGTVERGIPVINTVMAYMSKEYTPEEIFDHLRVRTLTSDFLYKYYEYRRTAPETQSVRPVYHKRIERTKPLVEVMKMLATPEPENEKFSLKEKIDQMGIKPFAEQIPNEPKNRTADKQYGEPMQGLIQPYHFIAECQNSFKGKPKTPIATLVANTKQIELNRENQNYIGFAQFEIEEGISKTFGLKAWRPQIFSNGSNSTLQDFDRLLIQKLIRHNLRNNKPVIVRTKISLRPEIRILIAFNKEAGKEVTYDAIVIESNTINPSEPFLPKASKIYEKNSIPGSEIGLDNPTFLE